MSEEKFTPAVIAVQGRPYITVAQRILWMHSQHREGVGISTEAVRIDDALAIFRATVTLPNGSTATGTGTCSPQDFGDYIEKAETKAVGRALGYLGYSTDGALDEEGLVVDTPAQPTSGAPTQPRPQPSRPAPRAGTETPTCPTHGKPMRQGKSGWFCPQKAALGELQDDNGFCVERAPA